MIGTELAESPSRVPHTSAVPSRTSRWPWLRADAGIIALLIVVGAVIRFLVARQSLFADELSTYWIVTKHGLGGVMSLLYGSSAIKHAEITPPLLFVLSWLTSQLGHSPELLRAPSLLAGVATIPAVYLLGLRTVGRRGALLATALTTLSPFMIYYSAEARSYAVMMLLVTVSTLSMLRAVDTARLRWWVAYAACSAGAFYTHYTCVFVLIAQFVWLLWAHPGARRAAVLANLGAIAAVLPWTGGLINNLDSPTAKILSELSPFTAQQVRLILEHWTIGFPYVEAGGLRGLPGTVALLLLGVAALLVLSGVVLRARATGAVALIRAIEHRTLLIVLLALAAPVGEAVVSALSTHIFGVRNLAVSWPALALTASAVVMACGPRLRAVAAALGIVAFGLGAAKLLTTYYARSDFRGAASFIAANARPGDVMIDGSGALSPGPLTGMDVALHAPIKVFRIGFPAERDHPFGVFDRVLAPSAVVRDAIAAAHGRRVLLVRVTSANGSNPRLASLPDGYRLLRRKVYRNFVAVTVDVWAKHRGG